MGNMQPKYRIHRAYRPKTVEEYFSLHLVGNKVKRVFDACPLNDDITIKNMGFRCKLGDFIHILFHFYSGMSKCTTVISFIDIVIVALSQLMGVPTMKCMRICSQYIVNLFVIIFQREMTAGSQSETLDKVAINAKGFISKLRSHTESSNDLIDSEFGRRISVFVSYILTLPIALKHKVGSTWLGYSKQQVTSMIKKKNQKHQGVWILDCLDSFAYLSERFLDCLIHKDPNRMLYDDNQLNKYRRYYRWLCMYSDKLDHICNEDFYDYDTDSKTDLKYTYRAYLELTEKLLTVNREFKQIFSDKVILGKLKMERAAIEGCRMKVLFKMNVTREREAPFAFAAIGPPGIGKTQLVDKIFKIIGDVGKGLGRRPNSYDPALRYNYNFNDAYMSGFTSAHTSIVMDDLGQFKDAITLAQKGSAEAQLISYINPNPLVTEQAELENKGRIPFLCSEVAITSNFADCGLNTVFQSDGGVWRRFVFIFAEVKPEFRVEHETRLKGDTENPLNPDLHLFKIKKFRNVNGKNVAVFWDPDKEVWQSTPDMRGMEIKEFALFMKDRLLIPHYNQQDLAKKAGDYFLNSESCPVCLIPDVICGCAKSQSEYSFRDHIVPPKREAFKFDFNGDISEDELYLAAEEESWYDYFARLFGFVYICSLSSIVMGLFAITKGRFRYGYDYCTEYLVANFSYYDQSCDLLSRGRTKVREFFVNFREKTQQPINIDYLVERRKTLALSIAGVAAFYQFIRMAPYLCSFIIGEKKVKPKKEQPATAQSANSFDKDTYERLATEDDYWTVTYEDMTRLDGAPSTTTLKQLMNVLPRNIIHCHANYCGFNLHVNILGIFSNYAIMPKHVYNVMKKEKFKIDISLLRHNKRDNIGSSCFKIKFDESCFVKVNDFYDYVVIQHAAFGTFRDIRKFFIEEPFGGRAKGVALGRQDDGSLNSCSFDGFKFDHLCYNNVSTQEYFQYRGYSAVCVKATENGFCGAPYLVQTMNGVFIGGIHVAYREDGSSAHPLHTIQCCPLFKHSFEELGGQLSPTSYNGVNLNEVYQTDQGLAIAQSFHKKSEIRMLKNDSSLFLYGNLDLFRPKLRSAVCKTLMCQDVLNYFEKMDVDFTSPKEVNSKICIKQTVEKMSVKSSFPPAYIAEVGQALYEIYSDVIKQNQLILPTESTDLATAINGLDGYAYLNRLPVKTSGGFAHKGRKDKYLILGESTEEHDTCYYLTPEIEKEVNDALARVERGERISAVWEFTFKDEPITFQKVKDNKCRLFNASSLFFSILERKAFLWCIPLFYGKLRHKFGCAMGANAAGKDWTIIYNHIVRFGQDRIIAGDYSSFDKRMEPALILEAFTVLIRLAKDAGFGAKDIRLMEAIATEVAYPITNVFGNVVEFYGTNPSGHSLTTVINSIVNIMYMMLACKDISRDNNYDLKLNQFFNDTLSLVTYGDDNIASSNNDLFTHTSISKALAKYGIVYTMADKEADSIPFITINEANFLKRGFVRYGDRFGCVSAPLDHTSIVKMLTVCTRSRSISFEEQCAQIIESACREYFQYSKRVFNKRRTFLESVLDKYNLRGYLSHHYLPTYEEMMSMTYIKPAISQSEVIESKDDSSIEYSDGAYQIYELESSSDDTDLSYDNFFTQVREEGEHDHISHIVRFYDRCNCMRVLRMGSYIIWRDPDCTDCHCDTDVGFDCGYDSPLATSQSEYVYIRPPPRRRETWFERLCLWVYNNQRQYWRMVFIASLLNYLIGFMYQVIVQFNKLEEERIAEENKFM